MMPRKPLQSDFPELLKRAETFAGRIALRSEGGNLTYRELLEAASTLAGELLGGSDHLCGRRVGALIPPGNEYVVTQWATWMAGGIAVPLAISHPVPELRYVLEDAGIDTLVVSESLREKGREAAEGLPVRHLNAGLRESSGPRIAPRAEPRSLILYTSGTTGRPKGVVLTHSNLQAQVESLVEAWGWREEDRILNVLPLHHTHGIVNVLMCALWSGASCEFLTPFDPARVWERLASGELSLFMAVPTIYSRLVRHWEDLPLPERVRLSEGVSTLRLMVSGSAALPVPMLEDWKKISGHTLLERYGMTEIGMALSNPLAAERRPGSVGLPLPGVSVRLVDSQGAPIREAGAGGEIQVRGPNVFESYWNRPAETASAFRDGWFQTGDVAERDETGYYRILGRSSVDIIKSGGYKISALEVEEVLLAHPRILECAVVGVEDPDWGERVCAAIVCRTGEDLELEELRDWARQRMAPYKVPSRISLCLDLPRNAMGKVTKPQVREDFLRKTEEA